LAALVHSVDAVLTGEVRTGEEKLEVLPSATAAERILGHGMPPNRELYA